MATATTTKPPVSVEYDCRGKRATKEFEDANAAKRFYATKDQLGKNPKVLETETPPKKAKATAKVDKPDAKHDKRPHAARKARKPSVAVGLRTHVGDGDSHHAKQARRARSSRCGGAPGQLTS